MTTTPTCPTCRYDLSATPDGRCPECGGAFTRAGVESAAAQQAERMRVTLILASLLYPLLSLVAAAMLADGAVVGVLAQLFTWFIGGAMAAHVRRYPPHDHPMGMLAGLSLLIVLGVGCVSGRPSPEWVAVGGSHALVGGLLSGFSQPPGFFSVSGAVRRALAWGGLTLLIGGGALLFIALPLWLKRYRYTDFDSLLSGGFATSGEVAAWGAACVSAGVLMLAARVILAASERRRLLLPSSGPT